MSCIFKYSELKKLLIKASTYGNVTSFEKMSGDHGVILRHDVDYDVNAAYDLAVLETDCNVNSTFFFLTTCPSYNLNSRKNRMLLKKISDAGFEVGLHFDPSLYNETQWEDLENEAVFEASIIEFITGKPVKTVSIHNPSIHGRYPIFQKYKNSYDPMFFQVENYMSDSRMTFRDKIPHEFISRAEKQWIQILLHPLHYSEDGGNYNVIVRNFISRFVDDFHECFSVNSQYVEDLNGKSLREITLIK